MHFFYIYASSTWLSDRFFIFFLGVIPQAVADIFEYIETHEDTFIFKVNVSFMELYQEQCFDLLSGKERGHSIIEIREDINKGVILPGKNLST